jgi:addiction module HigA family antidote
MERWRLFRGRDDRLSLRKGGNMARLPNIHPGEILLEEFIKPMGITAYRLAKETGVAQTRISQIINKKRSLTAETALRLGKYFGISPEFWLGLQNDYDLEENRNLIENELKHIQTFKKAKKVEVLT